MTATTPIPVVRLGRTDLHISRLSLGTANFGTAVTERDAHRLLDLALDHGITGIDTADAYGPAEAILGRWFAADPSKRSRVVLSTKVGNGIPKVLPPGLSGAAIRAASEGSLRRLQTDVIDVYIAHNADPHTPVAETELAFEALVEAGQVRCVGASNTAIAALPSSAVLQPLYNLLERGAADVCLRPGYRHRGIITYSPLAGGVLTGKYSRLVPPNTRAMSYKGVLPAEAGYIPRLTNTTLWAADLLDRLGRSRGCGPEQLALRWLLEQPVIDSVILGVRTPRQLERLLEAQHLPWDAAIQAEVERVTA